MDMEMLGWIPLEWRGLNRIAVIPMDTEVSGWIPMGLKMGTDGSPLSAVPQWDWSWDVPKGT